MNRRALLESMVSRLEAALFELQSVAHDARSTGLALEDLQEALGLLVRVRDGLGQLGQTLEAKDAAADTQDDEGEDA